MLRSIMESPRFSARTPGEPDTRRSRPHPQSDLIVEKFNAGVSRKRIARDLHTSGERINRTLLAAGVDLGPQIPGTNGPVRILPPRLDIPADLIALLPDIRQLPRCAQIELRAMHAEEASGPDLAETFAAFLNRTNPALFKRAAERELKWLDEARETGLKNPDSCSRAW